MAHGKIRQVDVKQDTGSSRASSKTPGTSRGDVSWNAAAKSLTGPVCLGSPAEEVALASLVKAAALAREMSF